MRFKAIRDSIRRSFAPAGTEPGPAQAAPRPSRLYAVVAGLVILCLLAVYGIVMYRGRLESVSAAERLTQSVSEALADQLTRAMQTVDLVLLDLAERTAEAGAMPSPASAPTCCATSPSCAASC
jgi:hypothetical protein